MTNEELTAAVVELQKNNAEMRKQLQEFQDRKEIWDALMAYCRGQDRLDPDSLAKAYHPDAIDDHGAYVGPVAGFMPWGQSIHRKLHDRTLHSLMHHTCDLDGDTAHCETYYIYTAQNKEGEPRTVWNTGRYVDRMEKRNGRWAIAERICIIECVDPNWDMSVDESTAGIGFIQPRRGDKKDPSYMRPLTIDRSRFVTPKPLD